MLAKENEVDVDVRKEDQLKINEFGKNNAKATEIREDIQSLKQKIETLEDASTELMIGDGEPVKLFIGESFIESSEEFANEFVENMSEKAKKEQEKLTEELSKIEERQNILKKELYARFGQTINLEEK